MTEPLTDEFDEIARDSWPPEALAELMRDHAATVADLRATLDAERKAREEAEAESRRLAWLAAEKHLAWQECQPDRHQQRCRKQLSQRLRGNHLVNAIAIGNIHMYIYVMIIITIRILTCICIQMCSYL